MPALNSLPAEREVLSPRSINMPVKPRKDAGKAAKSETKTKTEEKQHNPDKIDDKWRPSSRVQEPGSAPETYITGKKLGKGGFAVCFEGKTQKNGQLFALKVVKAHIEQKKMAEKFRTELQIHAKMRHPQIVDFIRAFTFEDHTYVVLELCPNGSLTEMVKVRTCLSLPEVRRYMIQICGGVKYLHGRSVIHRDLKMGNIFLDSRMNIKIGDFGLAAVMVDDQDRRQTLCGTPNYIAPEILSKSSGRGHDNKVDTWAIGVICYAMLIGTPPFQSKTQQEIYTKLRTLEYEWKIDSKNYIPQAAKDFVASCLNLVSSERPEMDDLVEYEFFKMGAVADELDTSCLKMKPVWLENSDPRGDRVRPGYGISQAELCRSCGVGRMADGKARPAVGEKTTVSTLLEIEVENRAGSAPTIPLPDGILYKQFTVAASEWLDMKKRPLLPAQPRGRKAPAGLSSLSRVVTMELETESAGTNENQSQPTQPAVAPRVVQSFAAQQRQQALPQKIVSNPTEVLKEEVFSAAEEKTQPVARAYLRERPVRVASLRNTRSNSHQDAAGDEPRLLPKSSTISGRLDTMSRSKAVSASAESGQPRLVGSIPRSSTHSALPTRTYSRTLRTEKTPVARPISSSSASSSSSDIPARVLQPIPANDRQILALKVEQQDEKIPKLQAQSKSSSTPFKQHKRVIHSAEEYTILPHTSTAAAIQSLKSLHANISRNASKPTRSYRQRIAGMEQIKPHVSIANWLEYASKYGVGYILTDGTVGAVFNSVPGRFNSYLAIRNGRRNAQNRARGTSWEFVPQGSNSLGIDFYECFEEGEGVRKLSVKNEDFKLNTRVGATSDEVAIANLRMQSQLERREDEGAALQRAKLVILVDKFAKWMIKKAAAAEDDQEKSCEGGDLYLNFYQKIGNVAVLGYSDGAFQFMFPDRTKLTVYHNSAGEEYLVDLLLLDIEDALHLADHDDLRSDFHGRRVTVSFFLRELLDGNVDERMKEILKTNEVGEKLKWISAIFKVWIREGGVGRMGSGEKNKRIGWSGLQEARNKHSWFTVGRIGGDQRLDQEAEGTANA